MYLDFGGLSTNMVVGKEEIWNRLLKWKRWV